MRTRSQPSRDPGLVALTAGCHRPRPPARPARRCARRCCANRQRDAGFAVYEVTRAFLPTVTQWPETGDQERLGWIGTSRGPATQIIQPGDMLNIRIWDSSDNSLLTAPEQKETRLEEVKVAANGTIFMPYVGDITVTGLTPDLARAELQGALEAIVPSARCSSNMAEGGQLGRPGRRRRSPRQLPDADRNYTVLSLLAAGGGVKEGLVNPQIRLMRGGAIYGTSVETLLNTPRLDTRLRGGDRVFVEADTRYFLSFGAAGTEDLHPFRKDVVSAMDAVSIMGGVSDGKADPQGLLVLREYPGTALRPGVRGPRQTRVSSPST